MIFVCLKVHGDIVCRWPGLDCVRGHQKDEMEIESDQPVALVHA